MNNVFANDTWRQYVALMRLDRPIGIYLLLWPTLWALLIAAKGQADIVISLIFIAGVILMRSAGCVINDYADRDIDPHVARTKNRPLASGVVSSKEALFLFAVLCALALVLVLFLNWLTIQLAVVALLLTILYPFTKRFIHTPQLILGLAFAMAVPMAFSAQLNHVPMLAWGLFTLVVLWTIAYDTLYAMVDRKDDLKIGVKSTAILFGRADKLIVFLLHGIVLAGLVWLGLLEQLHWSYYLGLLGAAVLALYQQYLIRDREASACLKAFLNNHWFGASIFLGIVSGYVF